jgi:hypothetical protein
MSENEWETLLEVFDRLEAEILKEALVAQGIPAQLFQEAISHFLYPVNTPMGRIDICVPHDRKQEALDWLEAYNKGEFRDENEVPSDPDAENEE